MNSEEADLYMGSMVWSTKGKNGKRWDLGNIKWQNFFSGANNRCNNSSGHAKTVFFTCLFPVSSYLKKNKREKYILSKRRTNVKKRGQIFETPLYLNP